MIGYLVDVKNDNEDKIEIQDNDHLGQFYKLIGCDCIDIAVRKIGGKPYNIVLDDAGLLKDGFKESAIFEDMSIGLVGNIIIFGIGPDGDLASIDDDDAQNIEENVFEMFNFDTMDKHPVVILSF